MGDLIVYLFFGAVAAGAIGALVAVLSLVNSIPEPKQRAKQAGEDAAPEDE